MRRGRFVCALIFSLLLHAGLLVAISIPHEGKRAMHSTRSSSQQRVLTVELLQPKTVGLRSPDMAAEVAPKPRKMAVEDAASRHQSGMEPAKREVSSNAVAERQAMSMPESKSELAQNYFEAGDLDQSATPVGEWYVLAEHWPNDVARIEMRVWISANGTLERWMVLEPKDNPKVEASLEYLARTILNPARRNGQSVASVMDVELLWTTE